MRGWWKSISFREKQSWEWGDEKGCEKKLRFLTQQGINVINPWIFSWTRLTCLKKSWCCANWVFSSKFHMTNVWHWTFCYVLSCWDYWRWWCRCCHRSDSPLPWGASPQDTGWWRCAAIGWRRSAACMRLGPTLRWTRGSPKPFHRSVYRSRNIR